MKKAFIVFIIIFIITALVPLYSFKDNDKKKNNNELATIFSSSVTLTQPYNHPLLQ